MASGKFSDSSSGEIQKVAIDNLREEKESWEGRELDFDRWKRFIQRTKAADKYIIYEESV